MKYETRTRWARAAAGWERYADFYRRTAMPVSSWMIEAIAPQPGHDILELAAGIGDTGFMAAELIRPGGTLICSDIVPEMLTAAQRRAEALGVGNVRFRQIDAQRPIDQAAASLDGVLCRWGYMLLNDGEDALRETRRILKPGGRVALAAWAAPEDNPWVSVIGGELTARGLAAPPDPDEPGQFAWAREGVIEEHLADVARSARPFDIHLRGTATFRPVSPVVFVQLVEGIGGCERLERAVRKGPLKRSLQFYYHPHVTVAHHLPDAALDRAFTELADFECRFRVEEFHLYEHGADGVWRPQRAFEFGAAARARA
jgi:SAM-dependent methyltransferase